MHPTWTCLRALLSFLVSFCRNVTGQITVCNPTWSCLCTLLAFSVNLGKVVKETTTVQLLPLVQWQQSCSPS